MCESPISIAEADPFGFAQLILLDYAVSPFRPPLESEDFCSRPRRVLRDAPAFCFAMHYQVRQVAPGPESRRNMSPRSGQEHALSTLMRIVLDVVPPLFLHKCGTVQTDFKRRRIVVNDSGAKPPVPCANIPVPRKNIRGLNQSQPATPTLPHSKRKNT